MYGKRMGSINFPNVLADVGVVAPLGISSSSRIRPRIGLFSFCSPLDDCTKYEFSNFNYVI